MISVWECLFDDFMIYEGERYKMSHTDSAPNFVLASQRTKDVSNTRKTQSIYDTKCRNLRQSNLRNHVELTETSEAENENGLQEAIAVVIRVKRMNKNCS
jgi:hypothetical protein